jgi:hypothetical protein
MFVVLLKEWKWIRIMLGAWGLREISQTPSGSVAQLLAGLGANPIIW